ncbi:hypothetical protein LJC18_00300 [Lachnospiraceae bacterium OttesenSCG-928-E19]|nr:hypothetical protein [Lachnospiraceae bacterium OttesenSCG-928-E19]
MVKFKSAIKKLKNAPKKLSGRNNFMLNMYGDNLKKLIAGLVIFATGYTADHLPDINISFGCEKKTEIPTVPASKNKDFEFTVEGIQLNQTVYYDNSDYRIAANRSGLADTLAMALDELARINPMTKGFVEDVKLNNQRFIIIPDSIMGKESKRGAFFLSGDIYLKESDIMKYKKMFMDSNEFTMLQDGMHIESAKLYRDILHEGRHAHQARQGIILLKNNLLAMGNILDASTIKMYIEGDATAYPNLCLYGPKGTALAKKRGPNKFPFEFYRGVIKNASEYSYIEETVYEKNRLSHIVKPKKLLDGTTVWNVNLSDNANLLLFNDMVAKMSIPISYQDGVVSYDVLTPPIIPNDPEYFSDHPERSDWISILPYVPLLGINEDRLWFEEGNVKLGIEKLSRLRSDKDYAIKYFEDVLRKQNRNFDNDLSSSIALTAQHDRD